MLFRSQVSGTITIDYIKGIKADGSTEVIDDFDKKPGLEGTATGKVVALTDSGSDAIRTVGVVTTGKLFVNVQPGIVSAVFTTSSNAPAKATLMNTKGQVISQKTYSASKGANSIELSSDYRGVALLVVRQGSQQFMQKIILK